MSDQPVRYCKHCRKEKPLDEFVKFNDGVYNGRLHLCKECRNAAQRAARSQATLEYERQWRIDNRNRIAKNGKSWVARNKAKRKASCAAHYKRNKHKNFARLLLRRAVLAGKIVVPQACEHCHTAVKLYGHHPDYSKPLKVIWLCSACHGVEHQWSVAL